MNLNKVLIIGRITKDPELKVMPSSGSHVSNFSVATNENYTNKEGAKVERVEFHNIVVYGKVAENCAKFLKKGQVVMVEGKIATRTWQKDDGTKAYKTEIIAFGVQFGPKTGKIEAGEASGGEAVIDAETGEERPATPKPSNGGTPAVIAPGGKRTSEDQIEYPTEEINPDDIPF